MKSSFRNLFLVICLSFSSAVFADEYDDLMLSVSDKQPYEASFLLKQYQEKNPSFGNVYYQMGKIFNEMIPSVHPLYDFSEISLYMYNARLYFGNCLYYATADEMKKYARYYSDLETNGKPLTSELLSSLLKGRIAKLKENEQNLKNLYATFYKMVDRYNRCTELFSQFNKQYIKIKNAHLLLSDKDRQLLVDLEQNADTLKTFIGDFQKALKLYPIENYNPMFSFQPIDFYRLDGLTSSDFLQNDIRLWDYSSWVKNFLSENRKQIEPWRKEMNKEQKRLASLSKKWFAETKKVDLEEPIFADRILLNKINKFDYESFMLNYFDFIEQSINVFAQVCASANVVVEQPTEESLFQQTLLGNDVSNRLVKMDEDCRIVVNRLEEKNKYDSFFAEFFMEKSMNQMLDSLKICGKEKAQVLFDNLKTNVETYLAQQTLLSCPIGDGSHLSIVNGNTGNQIVELDATNNELRKIEVGVGVPKILKYNEITQEILVALQNQGILKVMRCDFEKGVFAQFQLQTDAELVDIINVDENFMLIVNATNIEGLHSDVRQTAVVLFDKNGKKIKQQFCANQQVLNALKVFKLSNNNIAIVGKTENGQGAMLFVDAKADWR